MISQEWPDDLIADFTSSGWTILIDVNQRFISKQLQWSMVYIFKDRFDRIMNPEMWTL